ncbi:uncharacterized protein LOC120838145 [Ixodes scapularis]|uniref:uncharacterized protein LOC120838145 n=1 Tax=Ixodes scapularis TaxID=6945 RepID=UPI001C39481A|nr:uncharacterized protein LOC120838145 [Ixodes scapularis]
MLVWKVAICLLGTATGTRIGEAYVYPRILEERSSDGLKLVSVDGKKILRLEKASVLAETLLVTSYDENGQMTHTPIQVEEIEKHHYRDRDQYASLMVRDTANGLEMTGMVDAVTRIEPVLTAPRSLDGSLPHRLHTMPEEDLERLKEIATPMKSPTASLLTPRSLWVDRGWREAKQEVSIISDSEHHKGMTRRELCAYVVVFMTAVNMRFDQTSYPKLQFRVVQIVMTTEKEERSFLQMQGEYIEAERTIKNMFNFTRQYEHHYPDLFVVLTGRDLVTLKNGYLSREIAAAGESATAPEQAGCVGQATTETWYVGIYIVMDASFLSCTPYKSDILKEYLEAFVGGVRLYFQGMTSPAIEIVYLGSRNLNADEEKNIIGNLETKSEIVVKGGDAVKYFMELSLEIDELQNNSGNNLVLVLTGLNITEEETKPSVNADISIPDSSESHEDYDNSDEDSTLLARAASEKKLPKTVGGLSQYGSMCLMAGAIVQDNGRNFSGVLAAAEQVANVLGPMYNGTIPKRNCDEEDFAQQTFHGKECGSRVRLSEEKEQFSCLNESIDGTKSQIMTPSEFYEKNPLWTPCGTSYPGSEECQNPELTAYKHQNCSISCCLKSPLSFIGTTNYTIPAPDGEKCNPDKICIGGACLTTNAMLDEHPPKR